MRRKKKESKNVIIELIWDTTKKRKSSYKISIFCKKIKHIEYPPNNVLFRTLTYQMKIEDCDALRRKFFPRLKIKSRQKGGICEVVSDGYTVNQTESNNSEWVLDIKFKVTRSNKLKMRAFFFSVLMYKFKESANSYVFEEELTSNEFEILSKPDVYTSRQKKNLEDVYEDKESKSRKRNKDVISNKRKRDSTKSLPQKKRKTRKEIKTKEKPATFQEGTFHLLSEEDMSLEIESEYENLNSDSNFSINNQESSSLYSNEVYSNEIRPIFTPKNSYPDAIISPSKHLGYQSQKSNFFMDEETGRDKNQLSPSPFRRKF